MHRSIYSTENELQFLCPPLKEVVFPGTQKNTNWDENKIGEGVHLNHLGSKLYFFSIKGGIIGDELQPPPPPPPSHLNETKVFF